MVLLVACNNEKTESTDAASDEKKMTGNISYPYQPAYSHDFKIGDPNHSKLVLDFFKAWEENRMDDMRTMLTDSVWVDFSDGEKFSGTKDSLIKGGKDFRSMFSSVSVSVDGWIPVHANDKNEDWVLVWSKDINTDTKGKVDSLRGHSYYMIKDNKIAGWSEFQQKLTPSPPPPPQKK
jgi:hypothetical protein